MLEYENEASNLIINCALDAVAGKSLQSLTDEAADILKDPILIIDTDYKVISYSQNYDISDPLWKKIIVDKYAPYDLLLHINEIVQNSNPNNQNQSFLVNCDLSPVHKLAIKLMWEDKHIGYIVMFNVPNSITLRHEVLLPKISEIIAQVLVKSSQFNKLLGDPKHRILTNILDKQSSQSVAISLKSNHIPTPQLSTLVLFRLRKGHDNKRLLNPGFYEDKLRKSFQNAFITTTNDYVCALLPWKLQKNDQSILQNYAKEYSVKIMIGEPYSDFFKTFIHFRYLKNALNFGEREDSLSDISFTKDYAYDIALSYIPKDVLQMSQDTRVICLKKYDAQNKTELVKTLTSYFLNNRQLKRTADELFIHRNTLTKRMERISEIINIDFDNADEMFELETNVRTLVIDNALLD